MSKREHLKNKRRVVIKIGSSSLVHQETGRLNFPKMEVLVREVADLHNKGVAVVLVSSGAIAVGKAAMGITEVTSVQAKQACAAIGQVRLLSIYQKFFSEYGLNSAQILMTKDTFTDTESRRHARNTFEQLLAMGVIPIVNENDTISTAEIEFGDNDRLSAVVAALRQRRHEHKAHRCGYCYIGRLRYDHRQRFGLPHYSQARGRQGVRHYFPCQSQGGVLSPGLPRKLLIYTDL